MHAANQRSPRREQTTYTHAMKLCYASFGSHRKLGLSKRGEGSSGRSAASLLALGGKNDCKLILDQNLEQQGSMVIFRALQEHDAVNCEQSGVSQTSTVNIEVMIILCKSCNNSKLLKN